MKMDFKSSPGAVSGLEPWLCCSALPLLGLLPPRPVEPHEQGSPSILRPPAAPLSHVHLCPLCWRLSLSHPLKPRHCGMNTLTMEENCVFCLFSSQHVLRVGRKEQRDFIHLSLKYEVWLGRLILQVTRDQNSSVRRLGSVRRGLEDPMGEMPMSF